MFNLLNVLSSPFCNRTTKLGPTRFSRAVVLPIKQNEFQLLNEAALILFAEKWYKQTAKLSVYYVMQYYGFIMLCNIMPSNVIYIQRLQHEVLASAMPAGRYKNIISCSEQTDSHAKTTLARNKYHIPQHGRYLSIYEK